MATDAFTFQSVAGGDIVGAAAQAGNLQNSGMDRISKGLEALTGIAADYNEQDLTNFNKVAEQNLQKEINKIKGIDSSLELEGVEIDPEQIRADYGIQFGGAGKQDAALLALDEAVDTHRTKLYAEEDTETARQTARSDGFRTNLISTFLADPKNLNLKTREQEAALLQQAQLAYAQYNEENPLRKVGFDSTKFLADLRSAADARNKWSVQEIQDAGMANSANNATLRTIKNDIDTLGGESSIQPQTLADINTKVLDISSVSGGEFDSFWGDSTSPEDKLTHTSKFSGFVNTEFTDGSGKLTEGMKESIFEAGEKKAKELERNVKSLSQIPANKLTRAQRQQLADDDLAAKKLKSSISIMKSSQIPLTPNMVAHLAQPQYMFTGSNIGGAGEFDAADAKKKLNKAINDPNSELISMFLGEIERTVTLKKHLEDYDTKIIGGSRNAAVSGNPVQFND